MEMNEEGKKKMEELEKNVESNKQLTWMSVIKTSDQSFVILQKGEKTNMLSEMTVAEGEVFTVVEESASPIGGFPKLYEYITANLKYPLEARTKGIEGRVFVELIINTDGTLSNVHAIKGIGAGCDEEAINVLQRSPPWIPGKQKDIAVRQRMVIPINFQLGGSDKKLETGND
jgi:protein TonB